MTVASAIGIASRKRLSRNEDVSRLNVRIRAKDAKIVSSLLDGKFGSTNKGVIVNRALVNETVSIEYNTIDIVLDADFGVASR